MTQKANEDGKLTLFGYDEWVKWEGKDLYSPFLRKSGEVLEAFMIRGVDSGISMELVIGTCWRDEDADFTFVELDEWS